MYFTNELPPKDYSESNKTEKDNVNHDSLFFLDNKDRRSQIINLNELTNSQKKDSNAIINLESNSNLSIVTLNGKNYWECFWVTKNGKKLRQRFSISRYGNEVAKAKAISVFQSQLSTKEDQIRNNKKIKPAKNFKNKNQHPIKKSIKEKHISNYPLSKNSQFFDSTNKKSFEERNSKFYYISNKEYKQNISDTEKNSIPNSIKIQYPSNAYQKENESLLDTQNFSTQNDFYYYPGGVYLDITDHTISFMNLGKWVATWVVNGRCLKRSFSIARFGEQKAKKMADDFRKTKIINMKNSCNNATHVANLKLNSDYESKLKFSKTKNLSNKDETQVGSTRIEKDINSDSNIKSESSYTTISNIKEFSPGKEEFNNELVWNETFKHWCVELPTGKNSTSIEYISASKYGYEKAKQIAIQKLRDLERNLLDQYYDGSKNGVAYERSRHCWRVTFWIESKQIRRNKYFNISKYGWEKAKQLAIIYRKRIDELCGEEPTDWGDGPNILVEESPILRRILEKDHPYKLKYKSCSGISPGKNEDNFTYSSKNLTKISSPLNSATDLLDNIISISPLSKTSDNTENLLQNTKKVSKKGISKRGHINSSIKSQVSSVETPKIWRRTSDPNHPMSNVKGVHYSKREKSWVCRWSDVEAKKVMVHSFHTKQYGFEGAKEMAEKLRLDKENQGLAKTRGLSYNTTPGLRYIHSKSIDQSSWKVYWSFDSKIFSKSFRCEISSDDAKNKAIKYKQKIESLLQVNKGLDHQFIINEFLKDDDIVINTNDFPTNDSSPSQSHKSINEKSNNKMPTISSICATKDQRVSNSSDSWEESLGYVENILLSQEKKTIKKTINSVKDESCIHESSSENNSVDNSI